MNDHDPLRRWVEVGADAICEHVRSRRTQDREAHFLYCPECERTATTVLKAALPLIDSMAASGIRAERQVLADLRAKVEALPIWDSGSGWVSRADVLALFDGADR